MRRSFIIIFLFLSALFVFVACTDHATSRFVASMDTLYQQEPLAAIDSIDSFMTRHGNVSRRNRMALSLYRLRAQNSADIPFTSDSLAKEVAEYSDNHGNTNERMSAYYVLGSVYRDLDNYPEALKMFHKAISMATEEKNDVDYRLLYKIYGQNGDVLFLQMAFNEAYVSYKTAAQIASANSDYLYELLAQEQVCVILKMQNKFKKAYALRKRISEKYWNLGHKDMATRCLLPNIHELLLMGKINEAHKDLMLYRRMSGDVDSIGNVVKGRERYYTLMAEYNVAISDYNKAIAYYNKSINSTSDYSEREQCFKGLSVLHQKLNNIDSVAKYANLARIANDSLYTKMSTIRMQRMQAAFNYKMKEEAEYRALINLKKSRMLLLGVSMLFVIFVLFSLYLTYRTKMRRKVYWLERQAQMDEMALNNEKMCNEISMLENAKKELTILTGCQQQEIKNLINEKENLVQQLQEKIHKSESCLFGNVSSDNIVEKFQHLANVEYRMASSSDWNEMDRYILQYHPSVFKLRKDITNVEFDVTVLVRLGFKSSEICVLLGLTKSNVGNIRKRLYKKVTGNEGSSRDFDAYIRTLK